MHTVCWSVEGDYFVGYCRAELAKPVPSVLRSSYIPYNFLPSISSTLAGAHSAQPRVLSAGQKIRRPANPQKISVSALCASCLGGKEIPSLRARTT